MRKPKLGVSKVLLVVFIPFTIFGCSQKSNESTLTSNSAKTTNSASNVIFDRYNTEMLSPKGVENRQYGKFKVVKVSSTTLQLAKNDLDARIRADQGLSGNDTTGQKSQLLNAANQSFSQAIAQQAQSKEEIKSYVKAYGKSALEQSELTQAIIYLWSVDALKELMKASDADIISVADRVLL